MTLKHIMLELKQWFQWTMKSRKSRWKFIACICAVILFLILGTALNGQIMKRQYGDMTAMDPTNSSQSSYGSWDQQSGTMPDWTQGKPGKDSASGSDKAGGSDSFYDEEATGEISMEPTPLTSAIIIASVLAVAIITAMALYLRYRKKHMDQIPPLTVLKIKEE